MKITLQDKKLILEPTLLERATVVNYLAIDSKTTSAPTTTMPIAGILPLLALCEQVKATDTATQSLLVKAQSIFIKVQQLKRMVKTDTELTSKDYPFLMKHQVICTEIAKLRDRYGLFMDTGTGKTIAALAIMDKAIKEQDMKWLVVCPKSIIHTAWVSDQEQFFPDLRLLAISGTLSKRQLAEYGDRYNINARTLTDLLPYANIVVLNPEQFKKHKDLFRDFKGLVVDESAIMKSNKTQTTRDIQAKAERCEKVYLLSGKPAPNSPLEYFTQMKAINPAIFSKFITRFKYKFFKELYPGSYTWVLKPDSKDIFTKLLDVGSIFISKEDCLDLPDKTYITREVELTPEMKRAYTSMEKEFVVTLEDSTISATNKLAALMKLRQITSGFMYKTDENETLVFPKQPKIRELQALLEELGDNNAIIWVNFREEVRGITELLDKMRVSYVTAYAGTADVNDSIEKFKAGEAQYIVAHPKTLKYGVTFTGKSMKQNCTYAIYYSLSHSYEDYYQSHDRIYRKGQTEPCTYIFLVAKDTIDNDILKTLRNKGSNAVLLENLAKKWGIEDEMLHM